MRIGLIGAGSVVATLHAPVLKLFRDLTIRWVCDIDLAAARRLSASFDIPETYSRLADCSDVDAVLLAIPVGVRAEAWELAARRGWHVLCEKPAATSCADYDAIIRSMREAGRVVDFGFMRRFYAGTRLLREVITRRVFGEIMEVWAGEGAPQTRTGRGAGWYQLERRLAGGGVLMETGSHLLDQMLFASDASDWRLEEYSHQAWADGPEFDARLFGRLTLSSHLVPFTAVITRSAEVCNGLFVRYPQVTLALPPGPGSPVELRDAGNHVLGRLSGGGGGACTSFEAFRDEWQAFLRRCRSGEPAEGSCAASLTRLSVGLIEACYGSAAQPAGSRS